MLQLHLLRLLGSGSKGTLSSSREAGLMASPWLPSRASLKAFQESLLFVQMGEHSPKACIPTLPGRLSLLPSLDEKGKRGRFHSTRAGDLQGLSWKASIWGPAQ